MKHTDDQIAIAARQFEEWADNLDPETVQAEDISDLRAIAEAADDVRRHEALVVERVTVARAHGRSWNEIGVALGVTRQAARQRFTGKLEGNPGNPRGRHSVGNEIRRWAERNGVSDVEPGAKPLPGSK